MAIAFVLIDAESGVEFELLKELRETEHVAEAHVVYGVYDILAKIEGSTPEEVKETIIRKIRYLDHVEGTLTLLAV